MSFSAVATLIGALAAGAPPKTAQVSALEGRAQRSRGSGPRRELRLGMAVGQGDTIETQENARLESRFSDNSMLRLSGNAKLQLAEAHCRVGAGRRRLTASWLLAKPRAT